MFLKAKVTSSSTWLFCKTNNPNSKSISFRITTDKKNPQEILTEAVTGGYFAFFISSRKF